MARVTPGTPIDRPAAVHDTQLNTSGGGRTQNPAAVVPPTAAAPASVSPRRASAGPSTPAPPSRDTRAGVDPQAPVAALQLALGAAAGHDREAGRVPAGRSSLPGPAGCRRAGPGTTGPAGAALDADSAASAGSTGRTYTIALPAGMKLLSLNGRDHWAARHRRSQVIKQAAWALARGQKIPPLGRVIVIVEYRPPDRRHRDAENICIPSAKAAIDGIVQAGVLPDDECPRYVSRIACTIGEPYPKGMLVLYLVEVLSAAGGDAA